MKKILTLLLAVCAITLTSCKKDDANTLNSLNGTTWFITETQSSGKPATTTWVFSANTFTSISEYEGYRDEDTGTYTYNAPKVTITLGSVTTTGMVNESEITLVSPDGSETLIMKRK